MMIYVTPNEERYPMKKAKALVDLKEGMKPKEVAEKYDIPLSTVYVWKRELASGKLNEDIDRVVEVDPEVLHEVAAEIKAKAPEPVRKEVDKLTKAVEGLERLNERMQELALKALNRVEVALSDPDLSNKDLALLSGIIKDLYMAFNSKNITNVNVVNSTNISTEKREIFKAKLGA